MKSAADVYARSIKAETRRSYALRWFHFEDWCSNQGLQAIPPSPDTVVLYLQDLVDGSEQISISTVRGRLAAISRISLEAGWPAPSHDKRVKVYMAALSRILPRGARKPQVQALTVPPLRETVTALPHLDARVVRDSGLIALYGSGVPPSVIATLERHQVRIRAGGMWITHPALPQGRLRIKDDVLPAKSCLSAWMDLTRSGPVRLFNTTDENASRSDVPVSAGDIERTITRRLSGLGISREDPDGLSRALHLLSRPNGFTVRDRAILLVGFAAAMRRVDLTILEWRHVTEDPEGILIYLPYSKTDRAGRGRTIAIPHGHNPSTCPVLALHAWRQYVAAQVPAADMEQMPIFVTIGRSGSLGSTSVSAGLITSVVLRRTRQAGLGGYWGGRSLRAGLITSAADLDIPLEQIAAQSGHKDPKSLMLYMRKTSPFERNAAGKVGL
jgi:integrase